VPTDVIDAVAASRPVDGLPSMISYLTRALKTPTIGAFWEELAAQARDENWSHEEYLAALLQRQVADHDVVVEPARLALADDDAHRVLRAGQDVSLSPTEYKLLRYLLINKGKVVSKAQILDHVWQYDFGGDGGVVETYIGYLRRKVDNVDPRLLHTIRGVGYTLREPPS